jgi:hypothetical protein
MQDPGVRPSRKQDPGFEEQNIIEFQVKIWINKGKSYF